MAPGDESASHGQTAVLIANRAEIACRIIRGCHKLNLKAIAVFTGPDRGTAHTAVADEAVYLGEHAVLYTDIQALIRAAETCRADAVHPGYGFLSESPDFVTAVEAAGLVWLGPRVSTMEEFALKHIAKERAVAADVPVLPGSPVVTSATDATAAAEMVGYPILLKATGGGGGMGIYKCTSAADIQRNFPLAVNQGEKSFGNGDVFVEKFIQRAKHIEVQVLGDGAGVVTALGERECSVQRRHQKVVEEAPSPSIGEKLRAQLLAAAVRLCSAAHYRSAGTVEFLVDADTQEFFFLEVNTRLQVEHGITEMVTGQDIVEWMLRLQLKISAGINASGAEVKASTPQSAASSLAELQCTQQGHAIECRLCAEDPCHGLTPASGTIGEVVWPVVKGLRVDTWIGAGTEVTPSYDSLLAKIMVHASSRADALARMADAVSAMRVKGIPTNAQLLACVLASDTFVGSQYDTSLVSSLELEPSFVEVLDAGMSTTVQDYPGRTRLWSVGVPPSGPMDSISLQYANALCGNPHDVAALEVTLRGPHLKFHRSASVAICGGEFHVTVSTGGSTRPVPMWASFQVSAGDIVCVGPALQGVRCYIAIDGGFDAPIYLGSRSTFPSGNLGGYQGRSLQNGDSCELGLPNSNVHNAVVPLPWRPVLGEPKPDGHLWTVTMLQGPQAAPDYFTYADMEMITSSEFEVHYNSNRLGVRLTGPKPQFARSNGGEGGAHPSNVHDHVYPLGTINFTGDMPVILCADGPSLGGFVCPATTILADMWKWGQMRPGDKVKFELTSVDHALAKRHLECDRIAAVLKYAASGIEPAASALPEVEMKEGHPIAQAVLRQRADSIWRLAGERYVFVEFGDMVLDFVTRAKVAELEKWLKQHAPDGFVESNPGVRSALLEYDPLVLPLNEMLTLLERAEAGMPDVSKLQVNSRVLHLPMAFGDSCSKDAMQKYSQSVRPEAAYLPDNVPFVAEINGLDGGAEEVKRIMFEASYMVFGLGDVFLGAPCAVPVNPLHRLSCPKYNPARTFTWEGTVGLGGVYLCIYPMNSPGGYQLMGRSLPIWNTFCTSASFESGKPWLLEIFDQIRFYEVTEEELARLRQDFMAGSHHIQITEELFDFAEHRRFCDSLRSDVAALRTRQAAAAAEVMAKDAAILAKLEAAGYTPGGGKGMTNEVSDIDDMYDGDEFDKVAAPFPGHIWELSCKTGDVVETGDQLFVLEAMKMETPVMTAKAGTVVAILSQKGSMVSRGQPVVIVSTCSHDGGR
eukprot:jgi/Ulvmu1/7220/UM035_0006.1